MLSKARVEFLAINHTTATMRRMHTELRIVVMQRNSTCLPNMDESRPAADGLGIGNVQTYGAPTSFAIL